LAGTPVIKGLAPGIDVAGQELAGDPPFSTENRLVLSARRECDIQHWMVRWTLRLAS
jgi:hypothetical protein